MAGIDLLPMDRTGDFLTYLQTEKRYASHTIKAYRNDLTQFHAFCREIGAEGMDLDFKTIRSWVVSLMDTGISPRTIHRKVTALRSYCKYLIRRGELEANPTDRVLKPRMNKRMPSFVDEAQIKRLLDEYDFGEGFAGFRNRLIIDMLYQTGLRRAELIRLKIRDVDLEGKTLLAEGKRSRQRLIPISGQLAGEVELYLSRRRPLVPDPDHGFLFITGKGNPAYDKLIYRVVNKYLALFTTLEKRSPHILRHSFATHMLNRGGDLNAIKELLGHANLSATQVYTHNTFKKLTTIYNQAHPRA